MLDLFCGLGGASQAMRARGWTVVSVDLERRFKPTVVGDVLNLPLRPFPVDLLWASPVCTDFAKHGLRCFYPNPPEPSLAQSLAVKCIIDEWKPDAWIVENVWASRPWLTKLFGPVRAKPSGHALWSNMCLLLPPMLAHKGSMHYKHSSGKRWGAISHNRKEWFAARGKSFVGTGHNGVEAAETARIPYEISEAVCLAVERRIGKECQFTNIAVPNMG